MGAYDISHFRAVPSSAGYGAGGFAARSVEVELCCGGSFVSSSLLSFPSPPLGLDESREKSLIKKTKGERQKDFLEKKRGTTKVEFLSYNSPPRCGPHFAGAFERAHTKANRSAHPSHPPTRAVCQSTEIGTSKTPRRRIYSIKIGLSAIKKQSGQKKKRARASNVDCWLIAVLLRSLPPRRVTQRVRIFK